jgi:hypothetical protein
MDDDDYNVTIYHLEIAQIIVAVFSMICSLSVVFILLYKYQLLYNGKLFSHYILIIAICDSITSLCFSFGYPSGWLCSVQGFLLIFFARASWFWTVALTINLFGICLYRKMIVTINQAHIITLAINTLLQLLPLTTKTYYGTTDDNAIQVCTYSKGGGSIANTYTWIDNLVHLELIICFIILFILTVLIILNDKCFRKNELSTPIVESISRGWLTVLYYPAGLFIAWVPGILFAWYISIYQRVNGIQPPRATLISSTLTIFNSLYGLILSIVYYSQTTDARACWVELLGKIKSKFIKDDRIMDTRDNSQKSSFDYSSNNDINVLLN